MESTLFHPQFVYPHLVLNIQNDDGILVAVPDGRELNSVCHVYPKPIHYNLSTNLKAYTTYKYFSRIGTYN